MSNDTFEALYKKFENMIKVFIKKYKGLIEDDEIRQCCLIAIVKAHNSYNADTNMKFSNWVYQNMGWEIYREIRNTKHLIKDCISLQTPLNDSEDNITLENTLQDNNINIQEEIEDKLMIQTYKDEIEKYLDVDKADICILRWFDDMDYNYIQKVTGVNNVSGTLRESRITLIKRSLLFRSEYRRIHHIDDYSNPANAVI